MKINLIGMILNNSARRFFEGIIIDDGGESSTVAVSKHLMPNKPENS